MRSISQLLVYYGQVVGTDVNLQSAQKAAEEIADFEWTLANKLMRGEDEGRNFSQMYNPVMVSPLQLWTIHQFISHFPSAV